MKYTIQCRLLASKSHYSRGMFEKDIRLHTFVSTEKTFSKNISYFFLQISAKLQQNITCTMLQTRKCMYTWCNLCLWINILIKIITLIIYVILNAHSIHLNIHFYILTFLHFTCLSVLWCLRWTAAVCGKWEEASDYQVATKQKALRNILQNCDARKSAESPKLFLPHVSILVCHCHSSNSKVQQSYTLNLWHFCWKICIFSDWLFDLICAGCYINRGLIGDQSHN